MKSSEEQISQTEILIPWIFADFVWSILETEEKNMSLFPQLDLICRIGKHT